MNTLTAKKWVAPFADTNGIPSKFQNFWVVPKGINAFFFFVNRGKKFEIKKHLCWQKVFVIDWRIHPWKRFHWISLFISGIETDCDASFVNEIYRISMGFWTGKYFCNPTADVISCHMVTVSVFEIFLRIFTAVALSEDAVFSLIAWLRWEVVSPMSSSSFCLPIVLGVLSCVAVWHDNGVGAEAPHWSHPKKHANLNRSPTTCAWSLWEAMSLLIEAHN